MARHPSNEGIFPVTGMVFIIFSLKKVAQFNLYR